MLNLFCERNPSHILVKTFQTLRTKRLKIWEDCLKEANASAYRKFVRASVCSNPIRMKNKSRFARHLLSLDIGNVDMEGCLVTSKLVWKVGAKVKLHFQAL